MQLGTGGLGPRESDHEPPTDVERRHAKVVDAVFPGQRHESLEGLRVRLNVAHLDAERGPLTLKVFEEREGRRAIGAALTREHLDIRIRRLRGTVVQEGEHEETRDDRFHRLLGSGDGWTC